MVLVGDVRDKVAIIVDDMADTCGTLCKAAEVVIEHGARSAIAIVTHGILSGNASEQLNKSKLTKLVVTNTVPHEEKKALCDRIETIDIAPTVSLDASLNGENLLIHHVPIAGRSLPSHPQRRVRLVPLQARSPRLGDEMGSNTTLVFAFFAFFAFFPESKGGVDSTGFVAFEVALFCSLHLLGFLFSFSFSFHTHSSRQKRTRRVLAS
jgi:hypothetical protein